MQAHNTVVAALRDLRARIEQMSRCPKRHRLIREYNRRAEATVAAHAAIEPERGRLGAQRDAIERDRQALEADIDAFQDRAERWEAEGRRLRDLAARIDDLLTGIRAAMEQQRTLLDELAATEHP